MLCCLRHTIGILAFCNVARGAAEKYEGEEKDTSIEDEVRPH